MIYVLIPLMCVKYIYLLLTRVNTCAVMFVLYQKCS